MAPQSNRMKRAGAVPIRIEWLEAWSKHSSIARPVQEGMRRVSIGMDLRQIDGAILVLDGSRGRRGLCSARHGRLESRRNIVNFQRNRLNAVAVTYQPVRFGVISIQGRGQHEGDLPLAQNVARLVLHSGFQSTVGNHLEAKRMSVEIRRLPRIADEHPNVVDTLQCHGIAGHAIHLSSCGFPGCMTARSRKCSRCCVL